MLPHPPWEGPEGCPGHFLLLVLYCSPREQGQARQGRKDLGLADLGHGLGSTADCLGRPHRHVELAFHWQIRKPNLRPQMARGSYSMDSITYHPDKETAFSITPQTGVLNPHADHEFMLSFSPHEVKMGPSWWPDVLSSSVPVLW